MQGCCDSARETKGATHPGCTINMRTDVPRKTTSERLPPRPRQEQGKRVNNIGEWRRATLPSACWRITRWDASTCTSVHCLVPNITVFFPGDTLCERAPCRCGLYIWQPHHGYRRISRNVDLGTFLKLGPPSQSGRTCQKEKKRFAVRRPDSGFGFRDPPEMSRSAPSAT